MIHFNNIKINELYYIGPDFWDYNHLDPDKNIVLITYKSNKNYYDSTIKFIIVYNLKNQFLTMNTRFDENIYFDILPLIDFYGKSI